MKFFIDSADIQEIREAHSLGLIDGVTTNPSLIAKTGRGFNEVVSEICALVAGPVSLETVSRDAAGMAREGEDLARYGKNVGGDCGFDEGGQVGGRGKGAVGGVTTGPDLPIISACTKC